MKIWLIAALLSISCASAGQILLKIGIRASTLETGLSVTQLLPKIALSPYVWAGTFAFALSMVLWLGAIRDQQLSSVYPLAALGYILVTVLSVWLFRDTMTVGKIVGITLIVCGIVALNSGGPMVTANTLLSVVRTR